MASPDGKSAVEGPPQRLKDGELVLDVSGHRCHVGATEILLTVSEFELLRALMTAPGRVFSREELIVRAFGPDHHISDRTIDSPERALARGPLGDAR